MLFKNELSNASPIHEIPHAGTKGAYCHQLKASSIANPKAPVYIQKKVRSGIQDFPLQRVKAATLWR